MQPSAFNRMNLSYLKRLAIIWGVVAVILFIVFLLLRNTFFTYVEPGQHLIVMAQEGEDLPQNHVLATESRFKGTRKDVLGEGWHFILPIVFTTELGKNTEIPPGKVGIVTNLGGELLPEGEFLADDEVHRGIRRQVLSPGTYRLNLKGFKVEIVDAVEIKPGFVGVQQRLLGKESRTRFAEAKNEQGILHEVLQPGIYYVNTREYKVIPAEVGISQTTFHTESKEKDTAIEFQSKGGFKIKLDCTVEWEVLPEEMPELVAEYGEKNLREAIERTVIDLQAHSISRDKGADYGVQDFLEGSKREKFQDDFTKELIRVGKEKNVKVHSAFIRNIEIPITYMEQVRGRQIAKETELTNAAKEATAKTAADMEKELRMVDQKEKEVEYETKRLVASIDTEVSNLGLKTDAEIEKLNAEFKAKIATIKAQQTLVMAEADTEVTKAKETAKSTLYQLKLDVFQNDGNAFLRYTLAEQLNPKMRLRFFHAGPGTFWTNLDGKGMNLLLPTPGTPVPEKPEKATSGSANK